QKPNQLSKNISSEQVLDPIDYESLSWTFCYNDNCLIHLSNKEGSEWFLQKLQRCR
ncbi:hypothetical protein M406DRAFT_264785, partial [Cryphonectria parasitica EP155]